MEVSRPSELLRLNLEGLCLHATALRVMPSSVIDEASWTARDFLGRALNAPREAAVEHAVRSLIAMGALYSDDELATPLGAALAHLPLDPRPALAACYGRLLCGARSADAFRAVCCMDGKDPFVCVQCPSHDAVGGLFSDFEAVRTESLLESRFGPNRLKFGPETTHRLL